MPVGGEAAGTCHLPQRDAEAPALLPVPGEYLAGPVPGPGLRGKCAPPVAIAFAFRAAQGPLLDWRQFALA